MARGDYVVVTHPERAPAVDFLTRSSQGPFVDTGVDVTLRSRPGNPPVTERVYLAESTILQLVSLLGVDPQAPSTGERDAQLMAQGKLDGLKEGLGGDLDRVVTTLAHWLDTARGDGACHCGHSAL